MELWSKGVRAPTSNPALVSLAALFGKQTTPPPKPCSGCGGGSVTSEVKAKGGVDKNRGGAEKLRRYWTHGEGALKIGWGTPGDWKRCVTHLSKYMGPRAKGYCQLRHHDALGYYAGQHPGEGKALPFVDARGLLEFKAWDPAAHPRQSEGNPDGGRFKPKGGPNDAGQAGVLDRTELDPEQRKKIRDLVAELSDGGKRSDLTVEQRRAVKDMIDNLVDPTANRTKPEVYRRPFANLSEAHRKAMRSLVDDMSGDGRFMDLPKETRKAILEGVAGLTGGSPAGPGDRAPAKTPSGAEVRQRFEDGSAVYTDGTTWDPDRGAFKRPKKDLDADVETKAGAANPDGVMVAFYAPADVAQELADANRTPPSDMHVTLAYLGKAGEVPDAGKLADVVEAFAADARPVDGVVSGTGRFTAGDPAEGDPFYASVDAPDLPGMRQRLITALTDAGFTPKSDHGFTPHMTLAYLPKDAPTPTDTPNMPVSFGILSVAHGPDVYDFPMKPADQGATQ